jgi:hypothetical protein
MMMIQDQAADQAAASLAATAVAPVRPADSSAAVIQAAVAVAVVSAAAAVRREVTNGSTARRDRENTRNVSVTPRSETFTADRCFAQKANLITDENG